MPSFDAKRVTPLEWAGIGAGALAFIISFFPWYSVSVDGLGSLGTGSASAWNSYVGPGGWLAVLLLVGAAVVVLLPHLGTNLPNRALIWLGLSAAALVIILIRWVTFDGADGPGYSAGAGFGLFIGLLAALVSGVAAFLTFRATSRTNV